jgi:plastocyanin
MAACALSAGLCSFSYAQVTGKVTLDGEAPERGTVDMSAVEQCAQLHTEPVLEEEVVAGEGGELANVVVSVKPAEGELSGEVPSEPAVLDQEGCQYKPHVLAVMTGQEFHVKNSDAFLHNVHSMAEKNPAFNKGQPNVDPGMKVDPMKEPEAFEVKCDVHPWMKAHVVVFPHPYFAVSKDDGTYEIPAGLPDGKYTVTFWHEKFGEQEGPEIEVTEGKAEVEDFAMAAEEAAAAEPAETNVRLASDDKPACESCCEGADATATMVKAEKGDAAGPQAAAN